MNPETRHTKTSLIRSKQYGSDQFLLRTQVAFAVLSVFPLAFIVLVSMPIVATNPELFSFAILYGISAGCLVYKWVRQSGLHYVSTLVAISSMIFWLIPTGISLYGVLYTLSVALRIGADASASTEYEPLSFLWIPTIAAVWFGVPFVCSAFCAFNQLRRNTAEQGAAANP